MKTFFVVALFSLLCLGANDGCEEQPRSIKDKSQDGLGQLIINRGRGCSDIEIYVVTVEGKKFAVAIVGGSGVGIAQIIEK